MRSNEGQQRLTLSGCAHLLDGDPPQPARRSIDDPEQVKVEIGLRPEAQIGHHVTHLAGLEQRPSADQSIRDRAPARPTSIPRNWAFVRASTAN